MGWVELGWGLGETSIIYLNRGRGLGFKVFIYSDFFFLCFSFRRFLTLRVSREYGGKKTEKMFFFYNAGFS